MFRPDAQLGATGCQLSNWSFGYVTGDWDVKPSSNYPAVQQNRISVHLDAQPCMPSRISSCIVNQSSSMCELNCCKFGSCRVSTGHDVLHIHSPLHQGCRKQHVLIISKRM